MPFYFKFHNLALFWVLVTIIGIIQGQEIEAEGLQRCSNPSVRREWRTLSRRERADWLSAMKCLTTLPHDAALKTTVDRAVARIPPLSSDSTFYDDLSYVHMDLNTKIHFTGFFFPWHRAFLWGIERVMKNKCGFMGTLPYWDWTQDAADMFNSDILDDDPNSGLGGWGDPDDDYQITTGSLRNFTIAYPAPHRIRRRLTLKPFASDPRVINTTFTRDAVDKMVDGFVGDFVGFQALMESGPHAGPHLILGGDMKGECPASADDDCSQGPKWSPNDPLFFLHHATVDKLWYDWQRKNPENFMAFRGGSIPSSSVSMRATYPTGSPPNLDVNDRIPNDGLLWDDHLTIKNVMDPMSQKLCYIYQ